MKEKTKNALKVIITLIILIGISVGSYFILKSFGITDIDKLRELIASCGIWSWLMFLVLQILTTVLLCFVPGTSMTFTTLAVILFGANYKAFLICFSGIFLSSAIMDAIGRFGGSVLIQKLVGKKDYNNALNLLQTKGMVYVPVMYLLPVFPDDAICMCCGALKINGGFII